MRQTCLYFLSHFFPFLKIFIKTASSKLPDSLTTAPSSLLIKDIVQPLTTKELMKLIENNQSRVMFSVQGQPIEKWLRDEGTNDFSRALQKSEMIYADELMGNVSNTTFPTEMFRNKGRGIRV
jgi:hypothetical protein